MAYYDHPELDRRYKSMPTPMRGYVPESPATMHGSGATADRPSGVAAGYQYFDTDLGHAIWWDGSAWVDSAGDDPDAS